MGSIDVMPVTVACFYYLLVYFTQEHERKLLLPLHATAQRDRTPSRTHIARVLTLITMQTKL